MNPIFLPIVFCLFYRLDSAKVNQSDSVFETESNGLNRDFDPESVPTTVSPATAAISTAEESTPAPQETSTPTTRRTTPVTTTTKSTNIFTAPPDVPIPINQIPSLPQGSLSGIPLPIRGSGFDLSKILTRTATDFNRVLSDLMRTFSELTQQVTTMAASTTRRIVSGGNKMS